jgi:hypothetical protein
VTNAQLTRIHSDSWLPRWPALVAGLLMLACGQGATPPTERTSEQRAALVTAGLVAAFGFDEGSGSLTHDAVTAALTVPLSGQSWVVGKYGSALEFEDAILEVAQSPLLDQTTAITVSCWALPKAGEPFNAMLLAKQRMWDASWQLYAGTWHDGPEWHLQGTTWEKLWSSSQLPVTKWTHLAATFEADQSKLYVNGELAGAIAVEGPIQVTDSPLLIGGSPWGDYFRGRIDEVRIHDRALSASEIVEAMSEPVTSGATPDVIAPTVSLTAPAAGAVSGMVGLAADASDAGGVATVEFLVDGQPYGPALPSVPYQAGWHARSATPGSHELRARATDFAGNVTVSAPITVSVDAVATTPGLVAAFGFDEGNGEDVHDATGAGHDTVRSGQGWVVGKYGSALEFEDAFLEVEASHLLDFTTAMTVSAWVLPKAGEPANVMVLAKERQWDASYRLLSETWHGGSQWELQGLGWGDVSTWRRPPVTKWSHLAATYDANQAKLYVDGELVDEGEIEGPIRITDTPLRIGGSTWGDYFRGRIDEVRLYNRALSASEIAGVMSEPVTAGATADVTAPTVSLTAPAAGAVSGMVGLAAEASDEGGVAGVEFLIDGQTYGPAVLSAPYQRGWHSRSASIGSHEVRARATDFAGNVTVSAPVTVTVDAAETMPGLVAAFGFDEGSGEDVHDATGAGHDTVRTGQSWVTGKYGRALEFEDSFLEVAPSHLLDLTTAMTVSMWVLPKAGEPGEGTLLAKELQWETSYELYAGSWAGGPQWHLLGAEGWGHVELGARLPVTRWSHLAATYDGAWSRLYVDGQLAGETEFAGGAHITDTPLRIGGMSAERYFRGRIDEIRIYSRALSASELVGVMSEPVNGGSTGDATGPVVSMTAPAQGSVAGMVGLAAEASDEGGVASVEFLVDGEAYGPAVISEPYEASWHSRSATSGSHELSARATDFAGNVTVSAPVLVNVEAADAEPGLVAAFGFDEGSGDDVHDATGAGHDGVLSGQSWVVGKYGGALEFEDSYLELGRSHLLDLTTGMTLSAWVLPKAGEHGRSPVLAKEHEWRASFVLNADAAHTGPDIAVLGSTDWASAYTHTRLSVMEWSHLAATYEAGGLKLYVNGELAAENDLEGPIQVTDTPVRIGGTWTWDDAFRGRIDEVRIYNRALSGSEIVDVMSEPVTEDATADLTGPAVSLTGPAAGPVSGVVGLSAQATDAGGVASVQFLVDGQAYGPPVYAEPYQASWHSRSATAGSHELGARAIDFAGNVTVSAPVTVSVDAADTVPGLIAAFGFDEGSGEDVHDATGAGHDTVRSGQAWVGGRFGTALEFNGSFLEVEGSHLLDLTTAMTFSVWVLPKAGEPSPATVLAKEYEHEQSYVLNANSSHHGPELSLSGAEWVSATTATRLSTTKWSHLAGTYDGAVVRLYVDGQLAGETEYEGAARVTNTPLRIGGMTWANEYRGRIDELRIYNRALSGSEIADLMSQPVTVGATADLIAPTVSLTAPATGPVSGVVALTAQASDASGVRSLEFLVDGAPLGGPLSAAPYEKNWHSSSATPGLHELRARATDFSGNTGVSEPVTVSVDETNAVPGLVAAFGFDEGSGEDVHDATGAGHDTVLAGQSWAAGKYGTALAFDENFLSVAHSDFLDLTTGMTLSAWVQPTAPLPDWPTLVMKEGYGSLTYALYAGSHSQGGPSAAFASELGELTVRGDEGLELGLWAHVAATYDGESLRVYVNGEQTAETTTAASIATMPTALRIGGNTVWDGDWFYGLIDEVRIYNRALSPGELEADMVQPVSGGVVADTTPPQVAITSPSAASEVFGSVLLRAQASDAYGIESVQFFVDGVELGAALTEAPFETSWNSSSATPGGHSLQALAFDRSGNSALSAAVLVTVSDEQPPACDPATVNDNNPCTSDSCNAAGEPVFTPFTAGTSCSDGDRCNGVEACSGAGVCAPGTAPSTDATCDAVDDDCDGAVDEDFAGASTSCGVGACTRSGAATCQNGSVVNTCAPGSPAASDATCNGVDDDCDGTTDENYASVGTSCGVGTCAATGTTSCVNGGVVNGCTPGTPASADASCNGLDNDCDGATDEDYVSLPTSCGAAACAATGATSCVNGGVVNSCTPGSPAANDATCDGIDNDCDGSIDEDFSPVSTSCGVGACAATGTTSCVGGVLGNSCTPGVAAASDASCDGIDNDCNGQHDEDFEPAATTCGLGACAASGTTSCVNGAPQNSCSPGTPALSDASCNGVDDDCDGSTDEGYVAPVTHCGVGACVASGHELCVAGQLQNDCQAGSGSTSDASCNGVDDDCDGSTDEDYVATPTSCGTGACLRSGNLRCQAGSVVNDCTAASPAASDATCNGVDDDCNGSVDEDYLSFPTTCSVGSCQATGDTSCVGGVEEDSCTPATAAGSDETCDGVDNDCDGGVDEGYQPHATTCGVGACARTGTTSCVQGAEANSCAPGSPAPTDVSCNGVDDDCDGSVDEGYSNVATTCGVGACATAGVIRCEAGSPVVDCTPGNAAASDASCNGVDDDCNGTVDEDYVPVTTSCGVGACAATGTSRCEDGVVVPACTPGNPATSDSSCDGIDNDCDGTADQGYVPEPLNCGVGACVRAGETRCLAGTVEPVCTAGTPAPNDSSCNGVDDDCDGSVDENYAPLSTTCGQGSCLASGTTTCQAGHVVDSCQPGTGATTDSVCNGLDDDCDGSVDENYVPQATACGVGVCAAVGTSECRNGAVAPLCTAGAATGLDDDCDGLDDDCDGSVDEAYSPTPLVCGVGACRATGTTTCSAGVEIPECSSGSPAPDDASCDGIDNDCDGSTDEGYQPLPTNCGVGECARTGTTQCSAGQVSNTCTAGTPALNDASCNGKDDDCSGSADEDYAPHTTNCGVGACAAQGSSSCSGGVEGNSCTPLAAAPNDASCNGVDDDCDGSVDENYAPLTTSCGLGACAAQGSTSCSGAQISDSCHAGTPATTDANCNGVDEDCDGSADEEYQPQATVCGVGACRANGSIACQAGQAADTCTPLPTTGTDNDCDGIDDDCDGQADEAYAVHCAGTAIQSCSGGALQTQDCADQDVCNGSESCAAGQCVAGTPVATSDDNPCTADSCGAQGVVHTPLSLGSSCGQARVCDGQGACIGKPVITTQPSSVTVSPGGAATFGVTATGPLLSYQWRRLGQPIAGATGALLALPAVQIQDSGTELTVLVSNPAGSVLSSTAVLTVTDTAGPVLTVDGEVTRTAATEIVALTGTALDNGVAAASLVATSSRFPGEVAGLVDAGSGTFRIEVPVSNGTNTVTLIAKDAAGNATQQSLLIKVEFSRLPRVTITQPANGLETFADKVDVRGSVRSSLPPESIRLVLGSEIAFPTGEAGEYSYEFKDVRLNLGPNLLSLRAETLDGTVTTLAAVLRRETGTTSSDDPLISVLGGASQQFVKEAILPINGSVTAKGCTASVTVNGAAAALQGAGSDMRFSYSLALPPGDSVLPVEIIATDCDGRLGKLKYEVHHDDVAPVIEVALAPAPAVHNVSSTPHLIVGKITEANLAAVTSNQQSLGVLPGTPGSYDFTFAVPLTRGLDEDVTIEALDHAGNQAKYVLRLHLDAVVDIEIISPVAGAEIQTLKDPLDVQVVARIIGLPGDHSATVRLDNAGIYPLTRADATFRGAVTVRGTNGSHSLAIQVKNGAGTIVAEKSVSFVVKDANSIPLEASLQSPANGASNIEANEPVVVELNRPVADPTKIKIELLETVHGKRYKPLESGASFAQFTDVQLEDVNRDQQAVPGGMSHLPGDRLFVFYPARDYGYGGQVTVKVTNDGSELMRGQFAVRPLPTLVTGFVADQFYNPIDGLEVRLDDVPVNTTSNVEGVFSFGFGLADQAIPAGRHLLVINRGLKDRRFGTIHQWINAQAGRMEDLRIVPVPLLDASEPFRRIASNQTSVLLRGGDLELDLSQASLAFPDGAAEGDVHTNVFMGPAVGYPAIVVASPFLTYALQPMGIDVNGPFTVNFALPSPDGSKYIDALPDLVLLVGLDPNALAIVPVGVGRVDRSQRRVRSERIEARRLDFIGMTPLVDPSLQSLFSKFVQRKVDLNELTMALEMSR